MTAYRLIIPGETPSLKNSKRIVTTNNGRRRIIASERYEAWANAIRVRLGQCSLAGHPWSYPVQVDFHFYRTTRRRFDYINLAQGPLDLMVEAGILADDDMMHVVPGCFEWSVDKDNPRVEIVISEVENGN